MWISYISNNFMIIDKYIYILHENNNNNFTFLETLNYNERKPNHLYAYALIYSSFLSEHSQICSNFFHNQLHYSIDLVHG